MTIKVFIERGEDGTYGAYMPHNPLSFGVIGEGTTVSEARTDFLNVYQSFKDSGEKVPDDVQFSFEYDVPSFLSYYSDRITLAGLGRITGIAQGQLSHYVTGRRRPSERTVRKIEQGLHTFADELANTKLL